MDNLWLRGVVNIMFEVLNNMYILINTHLMNIIIIIWLVQTNIQCHNNIFTAELSLPAG